MGLSIYSIKRLAGGPAKQYIKLPLTASAHPSFRNIISLFDGATRLMAESNHSAPLSLRMSAWYAIKMKCLHYN